MTAQAAFAKAEACVFDAYGTLFDIHAPTAREAASLGEVARPLSELWRQKQIQYTWLRSLMGAHADFEVVTRDALDFALGHYGLLGDRALAERLMALYLSLAPYPDARPALERIRRSGRKTLILSNGSPRMLQAAVEGAGLNDSFDAVLSVESLGIYKPHPSVYALAEETAGVARDAICFVSSNGWDVAGAAQFGFRVAWINRFGQTRERLPAGPDAEVESLQQLAALVGA